MRRFARSLSIGLIFLALCLFNARAVLAHPEGHDGPVTREDALDAAEMIVEEMIEGRYLEASWKGIRPAGIDQIGQGSRVAWVVTYRNDRARDPQKRVLKISLDEFGDFLADAFSAR